MTGPHEPSGGAALRPRRDVDQADWLRIKIALLALEQLLSGPAHELVRAELQKSHADSWCSRGPVIDPTTLATVQGAEEELLFLLEDLLERLSLGADTVEVGPDCIGFLRREQTPEVGYEDWCPSCGAVHQFPGLTSPETESTLVMQQRTGLDQRSHCEETN